MTAFYICGVSYILAEASEDLFYVSFQNLLHVFCLWGTKAYESEIVSF